MKLVVLQPGYLPWLGFFDQYDWADRFVIYDDVQFDKHGWRNRNRILTANGVQWLTVPVRTRGQGKPTNREVRIDNQEKWRRKHRMSLQQAYARAPFFDEVYPALDRVLSRSWEWLLDLNMEMLRVLTELLGMEWKVQLSSELGTTPPGDALVGGKSPGRKTARLLAICRLLGATDYLTGDAARGYLEEEAFREIGVRVHWHGYRHPVYRQCFEGFTPNLSVVDLLFNHGPQSRSILTGKAASHTR